MKKLLLGLLVMATSLVAQQVSLTHNQIVSMKPKYPVCSKTEAKDPSKLCTCVYVVIAPDGSIAGYAIKGWDIVEPKEQKSKFRPNSFQVEHEMWQQGLDKYFLGRID